MTNSNGFVAALSLMLSLTACGQQTDRLEQRVDAALERSTRFLVARQAEDGSWRSEVYGTLRDGVTLTPPILKALQFGPQFEGSQQACERAVSYLTGLGTEAGRLPVMGFPVYSAALSLVALSRVTGPGVERSRQAFLELLCGHQLDEELGWEPSDLAYGGFGYSVRPPRRRDGVRPPFDADLSSTLFAVGAMRLAGVPAEHPDIQKALHFVRRCQNFADDPGRDDRFEDGGFVTAASHGEQNKGGVAGVDGAGRTRYHSYGSATADGLRGLLRCGLPADHPRVVAARRWLEQRFDPTIHPGRFTAALEADRSAPYFYSCWSLAHAFRLLGVSEFEQDGETIRWAEALATHLLSLQQEDGSFRNPHTFMKEDDPLIATPLAMGALGVCRMVMEAGPGR